MPIGLRGVGKTVLLNRFAEIAENERLEVGFIEAPETANFLELLGIRFRAILLRLDQGPVSRAVARALRVLRSFEVVLPNGVTFRLNVEPLAGMADSGNVTSDLIDLFVAAGEAARDRGTGIVLAVDEVQYLREEEFAGLITAIHRTTQLELPILLVGAGLPQLPGLASEAKSYAERLFDFPEIGNLNPSVGFLSSPFSCVDMGGWERSPAGAISAQMFRMVVQSIRPAGAA